ncbi:ankyrin repeat domain-containing protein, chloroplastic isoform X2 [Silene latifolia]|uniref:ankyrin repeat domain-containing protein, chloroplastic isoform X2 n=1 Tax=Silene latifolia TaxID=37657 RepID=UPI003D775FE0
MWATSIGLGSGILHSNPLKSPHFLQSSSSFSPPVFLPTKPHSLSSSTALASSNYNDEDEDDEPQVIGDCLVFEDGIFEDPFLQQQQQQHPNPNPTSSETQQDSLIPQEWTQAVEEINLTKKERRKIAQQTQFGQRIFNKKKANCVNLEEYMRFHDYKMSQLKPIVLDNPPEFSSKKEDHLVVNQSNNSRVEPVNPRWAVYGRGLDDISEFFNSPTYQPTEEGTSQGRQKLFTKEEKVLMNARIPKLAIATSLKWLPLHALAASGEFYLLNSLLKYEVDINAADQDGLTALHKAIICKKQAITNFLLRESANSSVRDKDGATLMHYAVRSTSSVAIKTLLLHNVDINVPDNDGWTPLHLAVQARRTDIVRLLLIKGANKTLKNQRREMHM